MRFIPKGARWYLADVVVVHTIGGERRNLVWTNTFLEMRELVAAGFTRKDLLGSSGTRSGRSLRPRK